MWQVALTSGWGVFSVGAITTHVLYSTYCRKPHQYLVMELCGCYGEVEFQPKCLVDSSAFSRVRRIALSTSVRMELLGWHWTDFR